MSLLDHREARSATWGLNSVHRHALTSSQLWSGKVLCTVKPLAAGGHRRKWSAGTSDTKMDSSTSITPGLPCSCKEGISTHSPLSVLIRPKPTAGMFGISVQVDKYARDLRPLERPGESR